MHKLVLGIIAIGLFVSSCGSSIKVDSAMIKGKWSITSIHHPMVEDDYIRQKHVIDTMTTLDLGQIAMWETNDIAVVKKKELKMIEDNYQFMKSGLMKTALNFVNDTLLVKSNDRMSDTCTYHLINGNEIVVESWRGSGRKDTMIVTAITPQQLNIEEPYFDKTIKSVYKK